MNKNTVFHNILQQVNENWSIIDFMRSDKFLISNFLSLINAFRERVPFGGGLRDDTLPEFPYQGFPLHRKFQ